MPLLYIFKQIPDRIFRKRRPMLKRSKQLIHARLAPTPTYRVREDSIQQRLREIRPAIFHITYKHPLASLTPLHLTQNLRVKAGLYTKLNSGWIQQKCESSSERKGSCSPK